MVFLRPIMPFAGRKCGPENQKGWKPLIYMVPFAAIDDLLEREGTNARFIVIPYFTKPRVGPIQYIQSLVQCTFWNVAIFYCRE